MIKANERDGGQIAILVGIGQTQEIEREAEALEGIKIFHETGTLSGGASGTYTANSILKQFSLKVGDLKIFDEIDGDHWREIMKLMDGIAPVAEHWHLPFPAPYHLKKGPNPPLLTCQSDAIGNINGGDRTTYSGAKYHIFIEPVNVKARVKNEGYAWCWETQKTQYSLGSTADSKHKIDLLPGRIYKNLLLYIRDNGSADDDAIDGDNVQLKIGNRLFYNSRVNIIKQEIQENHHIAPSTGYYLIELSEPLDTREAKDVSLNVRLQSTGSPSGAAPAGTVDITILANHLVPYK